MTRLTTILIASMLLAIGCGEGMAEFDENPSAITTSTDGAVADQATHWESSGDVSCQTPPALPLVDVSAFEECCLGAHCIPAANVPPAHRNDFGGCGDSGLCVPDPYVEFNWFYTAPSCTVPGGAEGRCQSSCIPDVASRAPGLSRGECGDLGYCVPCCDPVTGRSTGACEMACDTGPIGVCPGDAPPIDDDRDDLDVPDGNTTNDGASSSSSDDDGDRENDPPQDNTDVPDGPLIGDECCGGYGQCVNRSVVPGEVADFVDDCSGGQLVCLPKKFSNGCSAADFPACEATDPWLGIVGYSGVCLPVCLDIPDVGVDLERGNCSSGHLCVPCVPGLPGCGGGCNSCG